MAWSLLQYFSVFVAVSFRSASAKVIRVFLGGRICLVHLQLPSSTHPGCAVGGGTERCTDEGSAFTSHRQQTRSFSMSCFAKNA